METEIIKNAICLKNKKQAKYLQLARQIEKMILNGKLQAEEKIPSERVLAKSLGVSVITISKAMTELMNRQAIERRIGSGTYVCNLKSRSRTASRIGFFYHHNFKANAQYMNIMVANLLEFWSKSGIDLLVLVRDGKDYENTIKAYKLDGLMIYSPQKEFVPDIKRLMKRQFPVIALSSIQKGIESVSFGYSNEAVMDAAVSYLARLKHQSIALLLPDLNESAYKSRFEGFQQAMWKYKLPINPLWTKPVPEQERVLEKMLEQQNRPDAVILGSCGYVESFYNTAARLGLKIPDDISVLSIDENEYFRTMSNPPSAFRIDVKSLTLEGAKSMALALEDKEFDSSNQKHFEFVDRKSCMGFKHN